MFAAGYQPGVDLRYGPPGMLWQAGPVTTMLRQYFSDASQGLDEAWRSTDSRPYYASLEPTRRSMAASNGYLQPETFDWDVYEQLYEEPEQLQATLSRYISRPDSAQLGSFASQAATGTKLQNEAHPKEGGSPADNTSENSSDSDFVNDVLFELPGHSSPTPAGYHDFMQEIALGPESDDDSAVTAQQHHHELQHSPVMNPPAQHADETHHTMDDVDMEDLFMAADTAGAAIEVDASLPHLPQQLPTAAKLPSVNQIDSAQRESPESDSTHQSTSSSVQVRRAGEKRKARRQSPPSQAGVATSPAVPQTRHGRPTRKRRSEDVSSAAEADAPQPTNVVTAPETAHRRPAKRQKVAQSLSANKTGVPKATPANKRAPKRAARPASSFPELSQDEIAQAKADGLVWARIGSYEAWPAQVQQPTTEQLNLLPRQSRPIPADSSFVVFFGQHDFNVVSQSRITVSFEDGLRKCKARRGSALSTAVSEAVKFIKARVARARQTPALIGR